jgi:dTDP-4-amino-4,6-dideoxygalactose transaminase
VQAVVAEHMLEKIEAITEKRIHNALYLDKQLGRISGVQVPVRDLDIHRQVFHIYSLTFEKRDELKLFLESKGIDAKIHYPTPIHLQPAAKKFVKNSGEYPVAEQLARSTLSLPVHEFITEQQLDFIVGAIKEFYS